MQRANLLEKTLMLGKTEGRRRRGRQRMRWLDGITYSMDMSLSKLWGWWRTGKPGVHQSMGSQRVGHDWATLPLSISMPVADISNQSGHSPTEPRCDLRIFPNIIVTQTDTDNRLELASWLLSPTHSKELAKLVLLSKNFLHAVSLYETPVLWPPHAESWLIGKDSDAGRD